MASQPGFIRSRMYRSLIEDAELRFVNTAEWDSGKALAKARANPDWHASVQRSLTIRSCTSLPDPESIKSLSTFTRATRFDLQDGHSFKIRSANQGA